MFQSLNINQVLDPNMSEEDSAYWLSQLSTTDWLELLKFVNIKVKKSLSKRALAEIALQHFEFLVCENRADVWQVWVETHRLYRGLVIQFRRSESDWSRGAPEFVDLAKNEPLGIVNIAGRVFCKVK